MDSKEKWSDLELPEEKRGRAESGGVEEEGEDKAVSIRRKSKLCFVFQQLYENIFKFRNINSFMSKGKKKHIIIMTDEHGSMKISIILN